MNYDNLKARWPKETPSIIGAVHETRRAKLQQARREQRPFTVPHNDYGDERPVEPLLSKLRNAIARQFLSDANRAEAVATLGVCLIVTVSLLAFWLLLPDAVDALIESGRAIVAESRR